MSVMACLSGEGIAGITRDDCSTARRPRTMVLSARDDAVLRGVRLFERLPDELRDLVLDGAKVGYFSKGTILFEQGDRATCFYIILSGWVKLYRLQPNGTEAVIEIMGPGQAFAEVAMYLAGGYPATAEMAVGGRLATFSSASFIGLLHEHPALADAMLIDISNHLSRFIERVESSHCQTAPQRLADFLLRYCSSDTPAGSPTPVDLPCAKQLVANLLGMQPETLSRALAVLRHHGVVVHDGRVWIQDQESLRHFVRSDR